MVGLYLWWSRKSDSQCPGVRGIVVGMTSTTADTPRAHISNMATMGKVLRNERMECTRLANSDT